MRRTHLLAQDQRMKAKEKNRNRNRNWTEEKRREESVKFIRFRLFYVVSGFYLLLQLLDLSFLSFYKFLQLLVSLSNMFII